MNRRFFFGGLAGLMAFPKRLWARTRTRKMFAVLQVPPTPRAVTIGPGYKFPVLWEVVRPVKDGELVPDMADPTKKVPASNRHGSLFWVRNPYCPAEEWPMCFFLQIADPARIARDQAVVKMIEGKLSRF